MEIAHGVNVRLGICDIETFTELFDVGIYNPDTRKWKEFEVSAYKNELYEFVKDYTSGSYDYLVTFNGINFDQQVLEWVVNNHQKWVDLTNLEICEKISIFAENLIDNSNYGLFLPLRESKFTVPAIDLFRIHHFDNEARRTSLKWCEFMFNMDVEEMPVHFKKIGLTKEDILEVQRYRRHDVMATYKLLELTLGRPGLEELKDYKGKNKIQDRFDVINETGMPCLNWSDVKIGEEWNKLNYLKATGIRDERSIFPTKVIYPYGKKFKRFFPYLDMIDKFQTDLFKNFARELGETFVLAEKQEFHLKVGETTFTIAKGGLHSNEKNRVIIPPPGWILRDADVGGQYPWFLIKMMIMAPHLDKVMIDIARNNVDKRPVLKARAKELKALGREDEARPLMGLQEMLKLCNNGGLFGKLGQKGSFLEYPEGLLKVCLGCEMEVLILIEMMHMAGFQVVSGNTDGIVTMFPKEKEAEYEAICRKWEEIVGNTKTGALEYADFVGLWQEGVNSYIAKKIDGSVKKKGRFMTEFELNKNKSARIIPLAFEAYIKEGKNPIDFIRDHKNIFDFCIAKKASGMMHYEEQWEEGIYTKVKVHKKLVVFYISKEGTVLYKRGFNNYGDPMNNHVNAPTDLGQPLVTYFNRSFEKEDYGIDYNYYIYEVLQRMDAIEKTRKAQAFLDSLNPGQQLSLF